MHAKFCTFPPFLFHAEDFNFRRYLRFAVLRVAGHVRFGGTLLDGHRSPGPLQVLLGGLVPKALLLQLDRRYVDLIAEQVRPFALGQVVEIDHLGLGHH